MKERKKERKKKRKLNRKKEKRIQKRKETERKEKKRKEDKKIIRPDQGKERDPLSVSSTRQSAPVRVCFGVYQ